MSQIYLLLIFGWSLTLCAQRPENSGSFIDLNVYHGTFLRHNANVAHLVTAHPQGLVIGYNKLSKGRKYWEQSLNYPDLGVSFLYQDFRNNIVGKNFGLHAHITFYFLDRYLSFRLAQGVAYNTHPFDLENNVKNIAYGTHLLSSTYFMLSFNKPDLIGRLGLQAGILLLHQSNGNFKAPNSGTNVFGFNFGLQYPIYFETEVMEQFITEIPPFERRIGYNLVLMGGINSSDYINLGQFPFWIVSAYAEKPLNSYSRIQLGTEVFFSYFLRNEIDYVSKAFPQRNVGDDTDFKRIGIFAGHEFVLSKVGLLSQVGYYAYYPYKFEQRIYFRIGVRYHINKWFFVSSTLKAHAAQAEAVEWGLGIRL